MVFFNALSRARYNRSGAATLAASLLLSTASAAYAQAPADLADAEADAADAADAIVVTARNRSENIQDVPIPISVLNGDTISQQRVLTLADLTQRSPGLTATTPNARRTGVSLRGIGKTSGNDNMEAAVGVIVDDVFLGHVGMTYQDFTDLAQVEVLRGPQGTLLGKNTSLGVVKYTSKAPSFSPEGTAELEGGLSTPAFRGRASYSDAIVDDVLAFRVSAFLNRQDGDIYNINTRSRWHEQNRWGGRFQLLFKPTDNFSLRLNVDGSRSVENSNTKPFMVDPTYLANPTVGTGYTGRLARDYFGGYQPILGAWRTIDMDHALPLVTWNYGGSLVANWDVGAFEIKSISALRKFHFDANNDSEQTRFTIARSGTLVDTEQLSEELRLNGRLTSTLDFQAGLYFFRIATDTTGRSTYGKDAGAFYATNAQYNTLNTVANRALLQASLNNVFQASYQRPVSTSQAAFAQFNWKPVDRLTLTAGIRYTREQKRSLFRKTTTLLDGSALVSTGNTAADAIREAQIGTPTNANSATIIGDPIRDDSVAWLVNPSFKASDTLLIYASASGGGKSGAVAFGNNGQRLNVRPEKTTDYELGFKADLLDKRLSLNANLYYTIVRDYQNVTSELDATSSTGFSSRLGNIPGIHARGIEFDANLRVIQGLSLSLGGAYNKATYSDWSTATCPRSISATTCNNTGKQIVGAPKWTINSGLNYEQEIPAWGVSVTSFVNNVYRTSHNLEQLLSPYGWQKAYHITDVGLGIVRKSGGTRTELSVVAKNVFDVHYTTSINDFSNTSPVGYDGIGPRRYVGLFLRTQF